MSSMYQGLGCIFNPTPTVCEIILAAMTLSIKEESRPHPSPSFDLPGQGRTEIDEKKIQKHHFLSPLAIGKLFFSF